MLKGPEIPATEGNLFRDKEGTYSNTIRARWWDIHDGLTISDLAMPPGSMADSMKVDSWMLNRLPSYGPEEPHESIESSLARDDRSKRQSRNPGRNRLCGHVLAGTHGGYYRPSPLEWHPPPYNNTATRHIL